MSSYSTFSPSSETVELENKKEKRLSCLAVSSSELTCCRQLWWIIADQDSLLPHSGVLETDWSLVCQALQSTCWWYKTNKSVSFQGQVPKKNINPLHHLLYLKCLLGQLSQLFPQNRCWMPAQLKTAILLTTTLVARLETVMISELFMIYRQPYQPLCPFGELVFYLVSFQ